MALLEHIRWRTAARFAALTVGVLGGLVALGALAQPPEAPRLAADIGLTPSPPAPEAPALTPPARAPRRAAAREPRLQTPRAARSPEEAARPADHDKGPADRTGRGAPHVAPPQAAAPPTAAPPPPPAPAPPPPTAYVPPPAPPPPPASSEFSFER